MSEGPAKPIAEDHSHLCPVCGLALDFQPWTEAGPSDEICPRCGIQFGYTDFAGGDPKRRVELYAQWRERWISENLGLD